MLLKRFSLLAVLTVAAVPAHASDPVGVFALIDRVVLEPNAADPQRIQLWGVFALADSRDRNSYLPPERGYLYLSADASNRRATLAEWSDFRSLAGTDQTVGFGRRHESRVRVRRAGEKPENPDLHPLGFGLVKVMTFGQRQQVANDLLRARGTKTSGSGPAPSNAH